MKKCFKISETYYKKKFKFLLDVEVTNPLTTCDDLENFLKRFDKIKKILMECFVRESWKIHTNILIEKEKFRVVKNLKKNCLRQLVPKTYDHVAAFYILKQIICKQIIF